MRNPDGCTTFPPCTGRERIYNVFLTSTSPSNTVYFVRKYHFHVCLSVRLAAVPVIHWTKQVISCSFPCIDAHEVLCIDRLRLNVGVGRYRPIHLHSVTSWFEIYKRKLRPNRHTPGLVNLGIFWHVYISSFVHMQTFRVDSTHSFIHEASGECRLLFWHALVKEEHRTGESTRSQCLVHLFCVQLQHRTS